MSAVQIGVTPFAGDLLTDPSWTAEFATAVDESAAESVWLPEHIVVPRTYTSRYPYRPDGKMSQAPQAGWPESLQWLQHLAARTERVGLCTGLLVLPLHQPLQLAKRLATFDRLSRGRLTVGVGVGWLAEEFDALGVPFRERGRLTDHAIARLRTAWTSEVQPKPLRSTGPPIVIGGHSAAAMRRAARFGDGIFLLRQPFDRIERLIEILRTEASALGRNPDELHVTVDAPRTRADLHRLAELGVTRVVLSARADDLPEFLARVDRLAELTS